MAAQRTATKKTSKTPKTDAALQATVKFVKGAFYEDQKKNLWCCFSPKQKKTPDGHMVVLMQKTEDGVQVGEPGEEYVDTFVRQLTKAEVKEYRDACQREKDAIADGETQANGIPTTDALATPPIENANAAEPAKPRRTRKPKAEGKMSCPDAAAKVLAEEGRPMSAMEMIEAMATKGYWTTPGGATPHATLYSAIIREIAKKGAESRFAKSDRGRFTATGVATHTPEAAPPAEVTVAPAETPAEEPAKPAAKKARKGGKKSNA